MDELIKELTGYLYTIETFDKDSAQDGGALHSYLIDLTNKQARANFVMAEYKRKLRKEKEANYIEFSKSYATKNKLYSPSLAKDYIDAQSADTGYVYDLAERLSRCCTHTIEALRTIISSLKSERSFANFT